VATLNPDGPVPVPSPLKEGTGRTADQTTPVTATCTIGVRRLSHCFEGDGPLDPGSPFGAIECAECVRKGAALVERLAASRST
jgi:hypothetical protein